MGPTRVRGSSGTSGGRSGERGGLSRGRRRRARVGGAVPRTGVGTAGARAGQAGRALRAASGGGSRGGRIVLGRPARPRRAAPPGLHELAEPALLLVLRRHLLGAG